MIYQLGLCFLYQVHRHIQVFHQSVFITYYWQAIVWTDLKIVLMSCKSNQTVVVHPCSNLINRLENNNQVTNIN